MSLSYHVNQWLTPNSLWSDSKTDLPYLTVKDNKPGTSEVWKPGGLDPTFFGGGRVRVAPTFKGHTSVPF